MHVKSRHTKVHQFSSTYSIITLASRLFLESDHRDIKPLSELESHAIVSSGPSVTLSTVLACEKGKDTSDHPVTYSVSSSGATALLQSISKTIRPYPGRLETYGVGVIVVRHAGRM